MPRTCCLSLLGLGEAARAAVQGSLAEKVEALKSFRMVGHWYIEWGRSGEGAPGHGNSSSKSQRKVHIPFKQCGEEVGGQQGSL